MTDQPDRRKAWTYEPEPAPGLADLRAGGARRARFWQWWLRDNLSGALDIGMHFALKLLPMDMVSDLGAALSRRVMYRSRKGRLQAMRANLRRIRPDLDEAAREEVVRLNVEAQGRQLLEYSHVNALARHPERITVHGLENVTGAMAQGPLMMMGMHLGNWEIGAEALREVMDISIVYVPPAQRGRAWIAERVRRRSGLTLIPPGRQGTREMLRTLARGGVVSFFCDEAFRNQIRAPFFGRPPHLDGNYAAVAQIARKTGARICPWRMRRRADGFRFDLHLLPVIELPPAAPGPDRLLDDVALLNAAVEPAVLANIDQWYFLDNNLPGAPGKGAGKPRRGPKRAPGRES